MKCIEQILLGIETQRFFDTHYIIDRIIKDYHNEYLIHGAKHVESEDPLGDYHNQIVQDIKMLEGSLIELCEGKSCSIAFHGKTSICALWKRL